ncbi:MAG: hypothetical protein KIT79_12390 [Deltaproteobacteria bacterium]|nr:hypothetical protein [Deltaproteobacteria bacterium]
MKIRHTLLLAALVAGPAHGPARADDPCGGGNWDALVRSGTEAERTGKLATAFLWFRSGEMCSPVAAAGLRRVGKRIGQDAEKAGRLMTGADLFSRRADAECKRVTGRNDPAVPDCEDGERLSLHPQSGAVAWYTASRNWADEDRVRMEYMRKYASTVEDVRNLKNHLESRTAQPVDSYRPPADYLEELRKLAATRGEAALAREETEFQKPGIGAGGTREDRSLKALEDARRWWELFADRRISQVTGRADQRGDSIAAGADHPDPIQHALMYYRFSGAEKKAEKLRKRAGELGDAAMKTGEASVAARFYSLSGREADAEKAARLAEQSLKEKATPPPIKSGEEQKKFRDEQDALEKELGL